MHTNDYRNDTETGEIVEEIQQQFEDAHNAASQWQQNVQQMREFRLGKQWKEEHVRVLEDRGQAPIVVNRIHPAVELAKSMLTARRPSFRAAPREDSDNKVAQVISALLEYMYQQSDGQSTVREIVDDYYVAGIGYAHVYQDPHADMGKGEVLFKSEDPLDVLVDPNSRDRFFDDAKYIGVSYLYTKEQAKEKWKHYKKRIETATGNWASYRPVTAQHRDGEIVFPEEIQNPHRDDYIRGYEWYRKIEVERFRIYESFTGQEDLLTAEEFDAYRQMPVAVFQGQIITDPAAIKVLTRQAQLRNLPIQLMTKDDLIREGVIQVVQTPVTRIRKDVLLGETHLYSQVLPIQHYPIIPFKNIDTRTPFPTSDVRLVKGLQEYINKVRSLIIAHATTSTNSKVILPEGQGDLEEFRRKWNQPGVAMTWDMDEHEPIVISPAQLPTELYHNERQAKEDINHQLGLYEMMAGNAEAAPDTYRATLVVDEYGQRRIAGKMMDIESGLSRVGSVALEMMQDLYTTQKTFRLVQPNNSIDEYTINRRLVDDQSGEIEIANDITVARYDIVVVSGSTLPTNRYAQLEFYMDAYQKGIIDRVEVLKKTEVFDKEGVMQRTDTIEMMKQQLAQAHEIITDLKGDMQSKDREIVNLRNRVETEKFKSKLNEIAAKAKSAGQLYQERLDDQAALIGKELQNAKEQALTPENQGRAREGGQQ